MIDGGLALCLISHPEGKPFLRFASVKSIFPNGGVRPMNKWQAIVEVVRLVPARQRGRVILLGLALLGTPVASLVVAAKPLVQALVK